MLLAIPVVCFLAASAFAADKAAPAPMPPLRSWSIAEATSPVYVDGVLDEQAWKDASVVPLDYEWYPGDNTPSPVKTDCLLSFDHNNLYIAFRAMDPDPSQIRAHLTDRDVPFSDDTVGFMLDTFNDNRRLFQFRINPQGVQMDAVNSDEDGSEDWSWNAIWNAVSRITPEGYVVEVAIPFKSLRFPNSSSVQTWGFWAMRDYPRSLRHRLQSGPRDRNRDCLACQLEDLSGFQNIRPGRNAELDPTVTAHRTEEIDSFPYGSLQETETKVDPGLTARWGITPNVSLDAAINPDFSQVEADAAQLAVNERFALFFEERRPFFLEGADFFRTPVNAVFTRTVANPTWGLKLTGKQSQSAGGAFISKDEINNLIIPSFERSDLVSLDQHVTAGVGRYRRDIGKTSTLGVLITDREADDYHNRVGGVDGNFRFGKSDSVRFQWLRSDTAYPTDVAREFRQPQSSFDGDARYVRYAHNARYWSWNGTYRTLAPGFRADSGFVTRVDTKLLAGTVQRTIYGKPDSWFTEWNLSVSHDETENFRGTIKESGWDIIGEYTGPMQSYASLNIAPNIEYFKGRRYNNLRNNVQFSIRPKGDVYFAFYGTVGKTIDVTNAQQAKLFRVGPSAELTLFRRLSAAISHELESLKTISGSKLYDANLTQTTMIYHLNLRTFVRAIIQYSDVSRNPAQYAPDVETRSKDLFTQLLFSYKINPQTVLLAGYSDSASGFEDRNVAVGLTKTDRTVFVKVGYAWVF